MKDEEDFLRACPVPPARSIWPEPGQRSTFFGDHGAKQGERHDAEPAAHPAQAAYQATWTRVVEESGIVNGMMGSLSSHRASCRSQRVGWGFTELRGSGGLPHQFSISFSLLPAPPTLTAIFTASSIGSLNGTSIRSRPCS